MKTAKRSREDRQAWAFLSWRARVPFYLAVFCTFAAIGFLADALSRGAHPPRWLAFVVAWSGLAAVAIAWCVTGQRFRALLAVIAAQIAVVKLIPAGDGLDGQALFDRVVLDASGAVLSIAAGFAFFAAFITRELVSALRVRTEVALAREIHEQLVPDLDVRAGRYHAFGRAMPASEVGGDLFDVIDSGSGLLAYLADVTGHGVPAGMLSGMTKAAARMRLLASAGLPDLLGDLHAVLSPLKSPGMFVTCAAVRLDAEGTGELALAGHPPALRYAAATGRVERLGAPALPLGVVASEWESDPLQIEPGDVLALVSDGLIEVFDAEDRELRLEGIERALAAHGRRPLPELSQAIFAAARDHGPQLDDQTLLLLRMQESGTPAAG